MSATVEAKPKLRHLAVLHRGEMYQDAVVGQDQREAGRIQVGRERLAG